MHQLNDEELSIIIESLGYTKTKFESYAHYPSPEFQRERVSLVGNLISKVRQIRKEQRKAEK